MKINFELTMPNVGSWNGRWTGQGKKYYVTRSYFGKQAKELKAKLFSASDRPSWYYRWEDGWGANVTAEIVTASEARKRQRISAGFCGYEWMIDSIEEYNKIYASHQKPVENLIP
jgi:hypothetical protein